MTQQNKLPQSISTKFGTAKLQKSGYYQISAGPEQYLKKYLHRLIYEDFHGVTILPWAVIHHKDSNKLNNDIRNLQCLSDSEHKRLHKSKNYPSIVKNGTGVNNKQNYMLKKNSSVFKQSIKIQDLIDFAKELKFKEVEVLGTMKQLD